MVRPIKQWATEGTRVSRRPRLSRLGIGDVFFSPSVSLFDCGCLLGPLGGGGVSNAVLEREGEATREGADSF